MKKLLAICIIAFSCLAIYVAILVITCYYILIFTDWVFEQEWPLAIIVPVMFAVLFWAIREFKK